MNQKLQHEHTSMRRAMNELAGFYGNEHREFSLSEHKREVDAKDTRIESYWEWVVHRIESANGTVELDIQKALTFGEPVQTGAPQGYRPRCHPGDFATTPAG
ncbi:hypothetical protein QF002_001049 [Paraburkholderia youngii]